MPISIPRPSKIEYSLLNKFNHGRIADFEETFIPNMVELGKNYEQEHNLRIGLYNDELQSYAGPNGLLMKYASFCAQRPDEKTHHVFNLYEGGKLEIRALNGVEDSILKDIFAFVYETFRKTETSPKTYEHLDPEPTAEEGEDPNEYWAEFHDD